MAPRNREVQAVVSTSFPDLLGEEEARLNRVNYPSEVTIGRSRRDDAEVDGLLDELLNDGDDDVDNDTLTNSCDDRTELSNQSEIKSNQGMMEMLQANSKDFLGGILSFHPSSRANLTNPANEKTLTSTDKSPSKHVTYAEDVKVLESSSDDTSKTDSDRSSVRLEEDEEAIEIVSEDGQSAPEVEFVEDEEQVDGDYEDEGDEEDEEEEEEEEDDYEDDGESVESSDSNTTQDLLERAHDRLNMQGLYEEVTQLRKIVERKDQEIEELSGQLRRAVATKCDLVIAHTELERHHEFNLKQLEEASKQLLKANFGLVEEQASTDVQLMNEIVRLNQEMKEMKSLHIQELGDWERLHMNEMREKEFEIAQLHEEIRKLTVGTTHARKQKKLLGLARQ